MFADQSPPKGAGPGARPLRVAVVGSGIAGLAVAHTLRGYADVTLFEAGSYFGGHTHTVDVTLPTPQGPVTHGVDTGFLVLNERTYPNLLALFAQLDVPVVPSDMSFSVQVPGAGPGTGADRTLEWSGTSLSTVFAQRANLTNGRFWRMLADLLRFNRLATRLAKGLDLPGQEAALMQPLGEFLKQHRFSDEFRDWYFCPCLGASGAPHRPDAAVPSSHHGAFLPQPWADPGDQPPAVVHRQRRRPALRGQNRPRACPMPV